MFNKLRVKSSISSYDVVFQEDFREVLSHTIKGKDFIIVDRTIYDHHSKTFSNIAYDNMIVLQATEKQKSYDAVADVIELLLKKGFRKDGTLFAIGGGVVQDITAFIASILFRGVQWGFFPTTLLAQGDSCIGSKTSINFKNFKNQLGNFYPPKIIYIISSFLETLPSKEWDSGLGEMLHYFLVSGEEDFNFFKAKAFDPKNIREIVLRSLEIKKRFVEEDEYDLGPRKVLNYGHSFGHAIESVMNYSIPHGIAVAYGMDAANYLSLCKGYLDRSSYKRYRTVLEKVYSQYPLEIECDSLVNALKLDKKNIGDSLGLILTKGAGEMFLEQNPITKELIGNLENWIISFNQSLVLSC